MTLWVVEAYNADRRRWQPFDTELLFTRRAARRYLIWCRREFKETAARFRLAQYQRVK